MTKDFLQITDFTRDEAIDVLNLCKDMKTGKSAPKPLLGKTVACIFHKPSLRTRISFEVGINELGGNSLYITDKEIQLGVRESIYDVGKVLSRFVGMIMIRTFDHSHVEQLGRHATVPVVNGLTDLTHPCQVMGDIFTYYEQTGKFEDITIAFLGDGNNVFNSFLNLACLFKFNLRLGTSEATMPNQEILDKAKKAGKSQIEIVHDPKEAVRDADIIYTDVWASMGQKDKAEERAKLLSIFQVNNELLSHASSDVRVMHCLPANRGQEITDEVIDGPHSVVFDEAENRLHIQKAIMATLLESRK
ncbi:MAG: ornithine carbamoyltransferase [candidate division Zixibacteria bacterium]|nr:ornithine carbamoyltransferase [candidate division Zixibacteria bacterium]